MYIKLIRVTTTPERKAGFLERQKNWNIVMASCPGFVDSLVASDTAEEGKVVIITVWRDKESLDNFMTRDHDEVEQQSGIRDFYDRLAIQRLSVETTLHPSIAGHVLFSGGGAGLIELSEAYHGSIILRAGITSGLFDKVGDEGAIKSQLASELNVPVSYVERLCFAFASLGLITIENEGVVKLTTLARTHLLRGKPDYLGYLVLHNTRPLLWSRWGELATNLKLPDISLHMTDHDQFLAAMGNVADTGQTEQLLEHIYLDGRRKMLDIGGALGNYSIAILRAYPEMSADVLELPLSREMALQHIQAAGLSGRIQFVEGDYRVALPGKDYNVVLLANILRGEKQDDAEKLLADIFSALSPGGVLLLYDLFSDTPAGHSGILAGFFGLHLPEALNPSTDKTCAMLAETGFVNITVTSMDASIIANRLVTAYVPNE